MEEVDNIVIFNLKEIGVDLAEVNSLGDLKAEHVYQACSSCLKAIDEQKGANFPQVLPRGMSAKVSVTSDLANAIKSAGYKGELGYAQLLYPTAVEIRKVLMWLFDAVPKKAIGSSSGGQLAGESIALDAAITRELNALLQETWAPTFATSSNKARLYVQDCYNFSATPVTYPSKGRKLKTVPGLEKYYTKYLPQVTRQPSYREQVWPSVFETNLSVVSEQAERENEWNTKGLGSNLNPMAYAKKKADGITKTMAGILRNTMNNIDGENGQRMTDTLNNMLQQDQARNLGQLGRKIKYTTEDDVNIDQVVKLSEEELQKKRDEEILALQTELSKLQSSKEELDKEIKTMLASIHQIEAMINEQKLEQEKLEREYKLKKRAFDWLPNAEKNIMQLQQSSAELSAQLIQLAKEWEKHRSPLIEEIRSLREKSASTRDETKVKLEKIKDMRQDMKKLAEEVHGKDEKYNELLEQYNALPKEINRAYYTNRILDIVKNVKKQKVEINKILIDTRNLQKEINSVTDTLNRTFGIVDELLYQDAKKDATAKDAYKLLVNMNENFKKLIEKVEEIGQTRNTVLNFEIKIQQATERTSSLNLEQVEKDLKEIKTENRALMEQIKQQKQ